MAAKKTIFPEISAEANELLLRVCDAQGCRPGVVVEAALYHLLDPQALTARDAILVQGQVQLHEDLVALMPFLKKILAVLEAQQAPSATIATWDELYSEKAKEEGSDEGQAVEPIEALALQPGGWRKVFPRREKKG